MYTFDTTKVDGGYELTIYSDGNAIIYQPNDIKEGNQLMTKERAEELALEIINRLTLSEEDVNEHN